ncbi:MAG: pyruvate ferredoxin oxidoreductase [Candidatus Coatesbacteria bacterium]|nr:pyruvate ferredoxin oxidoreductase [Candidatus Coatesbacteria bacterium]
MTKILALTGADAAAEAMRQVHPDVVAAYPITPQTGIVQTYSSFVADGLVDTEMVTVESEHSAMSAVVGAASAGARAMTATSANGLALMWEIVYIAASYRLPIVAPVVNRALSGPINIHCDHSDSMGCRDSGWIQLFSENTQETYDNIIQAVKIGENKDVMLPVMITLDGFIISHVMERVEALEDEEVSKFVGTFTAKYPLLDVDNPVTYGPLDLQDYYFEHKRQQYQAMQNSADVIKNVGKEFGALSGRYYDLLELHKMEDAEFAIIALGSTAGTAKYLVDQMRNEGKKVGMIKIRSFRPFPIEDLRLAVKKLKGLSVLDRSISFGAKGGPVFVEVESALFRTGIDIPVLNYIYGLGGRDITPTEMRISFSDLEKAVKGEKFPAVQFIGLRG